jgi:hypothetical protein
VGRPASIDNLRLSAHSRGNGSMASTLQGTLLPSSKIRHVTVLDGTDFADSLTKGFKASGISASQVTAYNIVFGPFPKVGGANVENIQLPYNCMRSIGYARLINDGVATGRAPTPLPPAIASKVAALTLPTRGNFTVKTPPPTGKTNINAFCSDKKNVTALHDLRDGEPANPTSLLTTAQFAARANTSPYAFIEQNNVLGFNAAGTPPESAMHFNPQIYSHHLFVAEIAHELFEEPAP